MHSAFLDSLRDPSVRDLAWLLLSADLLRPQPPAGTLARPFDTPAEARATLDWLRQLDAVPADLHHDLAATRITRLGRYAERLLGYFLQHGPAAQLVAAGVQVRREGVTLGECDFLLRTQSGTPLHWELAVKCYLHAGESRGQLADYVGPNLKDRFDLKLAHLLDHQLPLSTRDEFAAMGYAGSWAAQMFVKGWLFYRQGEATLAPATLDASHNRGWWVARGDWPAFSASRAQSWRVLARLEWLAPRRHEQGQVQSGEFVLSDAQTLAAQLEPLRGPTMVAAFAQAADGAWLEQSRGFIVPDDWPQQAEAYARQ
ncbi:DUF1853 family protein [Paraburkholderia sp. GAS199]|uniref:DUF1853 family protein n=1 Tax=Paraburkholderia sp. GAS199 TaxID=3035126 RepID=UPI003D1FCD2C